MATVANKEYLNTGGGCMVLELTIVGGSDLKSVTINEEAIVGRNYMYWWQEDTSETLWVVTDKSSLFSLGYDLKFTLEIIEAYQEFMQKCNYEDHLRLLEKTDGEQLELIADCLKQYHREGYTVIAPTDESGLDAREVASYVVSVLTSLKCSFDHHYISIGNAYYIESNM